MYQFPDVFYNLMLTSSFRTALYFRNRKQYGFAADFDPSVSNYIAVQRTAAL